MGEGFAYELSCEKVFVFAVLALIMDQVAEGENWSEV